MEESFELLAIPLPQEGFFLLAHSKPDLDLSSPEGETAFASLPKNWRARASSHETKRPIQIVENGDSIRIRLLETEHYEWAFETSGENNGLRIESSLKSGKKHLWNERRRKGQLESGQFQVVNHLGFASIQILDPEGETLLTIPLEIVSRKFDFDTEYRSLTEDIAHFCEQLLLNWEAPTSLSFSADTEKQYRLILEQFLFLRNFLTDEKVGRLLEAISRNPHSELRIEREWKPVAAARSSDYLSNPSQMLRSWQRVNGSPRPAEVLDTRKRESYDTDPNRFIKYALHFFRQLCIEVVDTLEAKQGTGATVAQEAADLVKQLDALVSRPFFREICAMTRLPLDNQTLQKREGYREILRAWLLTQAAASLNWTGNEDCYQGDSRDVATLYEYWIFIRLYRLLKELPRMEAIEGKSDDPENFISESNGQIDINLQSGKKSKTRFRWTAPSGEQLNVDLYYERTFKATSEDIATGSYSRQFRPDYTFAIYPSSCKKETDAVQLGKVSYLHFDAKYRAEQITELFGDPNQNEDDSEISDEKLITKATAVYKRGDLLKMHTYNDALRNTIGSYVLYPGTRDTPEKISKFHEIAPGVGALSLKPGNEQSLEALKSFIAEVLDHQADQFSQYRYVSDTSYQAHKEKPDQVEEAQVRYSVARKNAPCVLLWLRASDAQIFREFGFAYCHAVPRGDPARELNLDLSIEIGSEFIPCGGGRREPMQTLGWRAKVRSARFVFKEKLNEFIAAQGLSDKLQPGSVDHYLLFTFSDSRDFPQRDVTEVHKKHRSGNRYMAVTCPWDEILQPHF
ncbi:DUF2357 domain-containing protein [Pelagicoccus albus]|uniref:DUF2357 domain-containing protein n=1 Tax=Pelagicoccus albus TaxID=415222 RepID=A0A7X1B8V5_9BACT|nr:DUF2357 domain-containing protein [Pelagicoccus albus]MBC2607494.1 DUF2357 domain-containing protein [Pelagicoccus albus]